MPQAIGVMRLPSAANKAKMMMQCLRQRQTVTQTDWLQFCAQFVKWSMAKNSNSNNNNCSASQNISHGDACMPLQGCALDKWWCNYLGCSWNSWDKLWINTYCSILTHTLLYNYQLLLCILMIIALTARIQQTQLKRKKNTNYFLEIFMAIRKVKVHCIL